MGIVRKGADESTLTKLTKKILTNTGIFARFNLEAAAQDDIDVTVIPVYRPDARAKNVADYIGNALHSGYRCLVATDRQGTIIDKVDHVDFLLSVSGPTLSAIVHKNGESDRKLREAIAFAENLAQGKRDGYEVCLLENSLMRSVWLSGPNNIMIPCDAGASATLHVADDAYLDSVLRREIRRDEILKSRPPSLDPEAGGS